MLPAAVLMTSLGAQADAETKEWLTAMQWMKRDDGSNSPRASRASSRISTKHLMPADEDDVYVDLLRRAEDADAADGSAPTLGTLNPLVRPSLVDRKQARVIEMLESGVRHQLMPTTPPSSAIPWL